MKKDEGGHRMNRPKFQDTKRKALKDSAVKQEYDRLQPGYDLVRQLLHMRMESGLTQEELAKKLGTKNPNISRLESPSHGQSPRLTTIKRYAEATGYEMQIRFKRINKTKKSDVHPSSQRLISESTAETNRYQIPFLVSKKSLSKHH
jgi:transcriptional regulator with XRE-family HTH domain